MFSRSFPGVFQAFSSSFLALITTRGEGMGLWEWGEWGDPPSPVLSPFLWGREPLSVRSLFPEIPFFVGSPF